VEQIFFSMTLAGTFVLSMIGMMLIGTAVLTIGMIIVTYCVSVVIITLQVYIVHVVS
jgi:hypothetical protein